MAFLSFRRPGLGDAGERPPRAAERLFGLDAVFRKKEGERGGKARRFPSPPLFPPLFFGKRGADYCPMRMRRNRAPRISAASRTSFSCDFFSMNASKSAKAGRDARKSGMSS